MRFSYPEIGSLCAGEAVMRVPSCKTTPTSRLTLHGLVPNAALALLVATAGLIAPAWGNDTHELRLAQATAQGDAGLDEAAAEKLLEQARKLQEAGDLKGAAELYERVLAWSEKTNGPEHPDTGMALFLLGSVYANQGEYAKAEPLLIRELSISEKALGPEHPSTATSLNNLGGLYFAQGLYRKAEPFARRSLAIREKVLGPENTDTATSLYSLARLDDNQGLYDKAEFLYQRVLAIKGKALGPEHPDTATILSSLALLYAN